jgi:hypothetical protein
MITISTNRIRTVWVSSSFGGDVKTTGMIYSIKDDDSIIILLTSVVDGFNMQIDIFQLFQSFCLLSQILSNDPLYFS